MSRKKSTRQLIGIDDIKNGSVVTADGELAFYFVHPSNLNVLPEQGVRAKVQELLGVLKGTAELELLALDSKESFQDNRQFYRQRLEAEDMPAIRGLLVQDRQHLDSVQTTMASSREFCFVLRRRKTDGTMNYAPLEQQFRDCGFVVQRAEVGKQLRFCSAGRFTICTRLHLPPLPCIHQITSIQTHCARNFCDGIQLRHNFSGFIFSDCRISHTAFFGQFLLRHFGIRASLFYLFSNSHRITSLLLYQDFREKSRPKRIYFYY